MGNIGLANQLFDLLRKRGRVGGEIAQSDVGRKAGRDRIAIRARAERADAVT